MSRTTADGSYFSMPRNCEEARNLQDDTRRFDYGTAYFGGLESGWNARSSPYFVPRVLEALNRHRPKVILDLGCGNGFYFSVLSSQQADVYGADASPAAAQISSQAGYRDVRQCLAEALDYPNDMFDFIFTTEVLEHIEDHRRMLEEMYRVLKPGGHFILTTTLYGPSLWQLLLTRGKTASAYLAGLTDYVRGYWSSQHAERFVREWCFEPLGGHFHGFHRSSLCHDLLKCGLRVNRAESLYISKPFPLFEGYSVHEVWRSRRGLGKKLVLMIGCFVRGPLNHALELCGAMASNVVLYGDKPIR